MRYRVSEIETVATSGGPRKGMRPDELDARVRWLASTWSASLPTPGSRVAHERELHRFLDWCAAAGIAPLEVTEADTARFLDGNRHLAPSTRERRRARLRSFYRAAVAAGTIATNPFAG